MLMVEVLMMAISPTLSSTSAKTIFFTLGFNNGFYHDINGFESVSVGQRGRMRNTPPISNAFIFLCQRHRSLLVCRSARPLPRCLHQDGGAFKAGLVRYRRP